MRQKVIELPDSLNKRYMNLKLTELRYMLNMFLVNQNQLNRYTVTLPGVLTCITNALSSNTYVEPVPTASKSILYSQLFEELKTVL